MKLDDLLRPPIQQDRSRAGLAVLEPQMIAIHLPPPEANDLVLAASGQEQEADDVGLIATPAAGMTVKALMQPADFLPREEPRALRARSWPDAPDRAGGNVLAADRMVEDLPQHSQCKIGRPG